jgi:hypothetical protein
MVRNAQYQRILPNGPELICGDCLLDLMGDETGTMMGYTQYRTV